MQSKPKANSIITSSFNAERNTLIFTVQGVGDVELDLSKVSRENLARAAIHGFNQRIPDAAAIGTLDKDGDVIPRAERNRIKFERMNDVCRHYESGTDQWSRKAEGGGGGRSLTVEAIARVKDVDYEAAEAMVTRHAEAVCGGDRKKALTHLGAGKRVAAAMAEIRQERDARKAGSLPDSDSLLDDLE